MHEPYLKQDLYGDYCLDSEGERVLYPIISWARGMEEQSQLLHVGLAILSLGTIFTILALRAGDMPVFWLVISLVVLGLWGVAHFFIHRALLRKQYLHVHSVYEDKDQYAALLEYDPKAARLVYEVMELSSKRYKLHEMSRE